MALGVIGGIVSAVGAIAQASAQASAARYNAAVNERNAQIARQQGAAEAERQDRINRIRLGALKASFGDAGLGFEGSALTIFQDAATQTELDKQNVRYKAALRATGYTDQAKLDDMQASAASTAGILGAFSSIVGAGSSILRAA